MKLASHLALLDAHGKVLFEIIKQIFCVFLQYGVPVFIADDLEHSFDAIKDQYNVAGILFVVAR